MSRLEDAALAVVQYIDRGDQRLEPVIFFVLFDDDSFRRGGLVNEMVLPFAGFALIANRRIDRCITAEASIYVDNILARDIKVLRDRGDLIGM